MITDFLKNVKSTAYHIYSKELLTLYMELNRIVLELMMLEALPTKGEREMIRIAIKKMEMELAQFDLWELVKKIETH